MGLCILALACCLELPAETTGAPVCSLVMFRTAGWGGGWFVGPLIQCLLVHPGCVTYLKAVLFLLPPDGCLVSTCHKGETTLLGARYTVSPG